MVNEFHWGGECQATLMSWKASELCIPSLKKDLRLQGDSGITGIE